MEQEKKKGSFGKVLLVIILLIVFAVGGWFCNEYYRNNIASKDTEKEEQDGELDVKSDLVQKLYNKVTVNGEGKGNSLKNWIYGENGELDISKDDGVTLMKLVVINLDNSKLEEISCEGLNIPETINNFTNYCKFYSTATTIKSYKSDYVSSVFKDIYGKNVKMNSEAYMDDKINIGRYFPVGDRYYEYTITTGVEYGPAGYTDTIEKAEKVGNKLKIYENEIYELEGEEPVTNKFIYTFEKQDDNSYAFISRKKA